MEYLSPLIRPFLIAFLSSLLLTPLLRRAAMGIGFIDDPKPHKFHKAPTALLGGVGIYTAFALALLLTRGLDRPLRGILLGATLLLILGLVDDRQGMNPWTKLLGQTIAAASAVLAGIQISFLFTPYLNIPITLLWIVGITNTFNLLDNMDGLSAGVAFIAASTFAVLASRYAEVGPEQLPAVVAAISLAGACLGFLVYNLKPASIFMGDAGSLVVGYVLASVAALGSWKSPTTPTSVLIPLLVLAYPIFDTILVTILRWRRGLPIFQGGKDHSSHRLVSLGLSELEVVLLIYLFSLCHALTAALVTSITLRLSLIALTVSASVLFIFGMILRKAKV
ncbi:MAG: undecaprenyl/decaprenyl-phosphate alpha-N-acetylglucosaminyl 1-phosphate transferase [candidate division NC10 bacterium]|nr:undecaprenyl/decaprenyl-phosphate alpha-N-acetylglucosaminyl 1-phosphate transferase [candidate division NC10 bacterium]